MPGPTLLQAPRAHLILETDAKLGAIRDDRGAMRRPTGSQVQRWADLATPPLAATFLILVADESAEVIFAAVIGLLVPWISVLFAAAATLLQRRDVE
jgi:hypothetical protein